MGDLPKIGIDIGSETIKVVELAPVGRGKWKLTAAGTILTPGGLGVVGDQAVAAAIAAAIAKLLKEVGAKSKRVVGALPEEQVSSHVVEMPLMSEGEVEQALQWQVEQYIPIPADKAVWSYQVIKKDTVGEGMEVLLVAVSKVLVNSYTSLLEQAGLEVVALENELSAVARAVVPGEYPLSMVVDIGARSCDVGVVKSGQLVFSRTVPTAGEAFTRAIESSLGLDLAQAEQYKQAYGFTQGKLEGRLVTAMKPILVIIANEIRKTAEFYASKHGGEGVKLVTLSGGAAMLAGAVIEISAMLGLEVAVGNPFLRVNLDASQTKVLAGNAPFYGVAAGLAMRKL